MKDHPASTECSWAKVQLSLLSESSHVNKSTSSAHNNFLSVVINGEIFAFHGCTYQSKGKGYIVVSSGWYKPSDDLSVAVTEVIWIGQIKRLLSTLLFMALFHQSINISSYWLWFTFLWAIGRKFLFCYKHF